MIRSEAVLGLPEYEVTGIEEVAGEVRVQADFVRDHLFDNLLKNPRNTVRFSIGPAFNFGPNIAK